MRVGPLLALALLGAAAAGCETPVGRYFANRARDFGECWRVEVGGGIGLGGSVHAAGVAHVGVIGGAPFPWAAVGWSYGLGFAFGLRTPDETGYIGADFYPPITFIPNHGMNGQLHFGPRGAAEADGDDGLHRCFLLLPCVFSRLGHDERWLWQREDSPAVRKARIHAFDVEVSAYALVVGAAVGFSPGEFLDFLVGWFGLDLAGDDSG